MFSLVGRLPSMPSANGFPSCSGTSSYCSTVRLPSNVHVGLLVHDLLQPACSRNRDGRCWGLPVLAHGVSMHAWVSDCAESFESSRWRFHQCGLPSRWTTSALRIDLFRSSISACMCPVNASRTALRLAAHDSGQGGSLRLPCVTLSFTTPYRFLPRTHQDMRVRIRRFRMFEPLRAGGSIRLSPQELRRSAGFRFGFTVF